MYPDNTTSAVNKPINTYVPTYPQEDMIDYSFENRWPVTVKINLDTASGRALYRGIKSAISIGLPTLALIALQYFTGKDAIDLQTIGIIGPIATVLLGVDKYARDTKKG